HHPEVVAHLAAELAHVVRDEQRAGHQHCHHGRDHGDHQQLAADEEVLDEPSQHYFASVAMRRRLASNSLPSERELGRLMRMSGFLSALIPMPMATPRWTYSGTPVAVVMPRVWLTLRSCSRPSALPGAM